MRRFLVQLSFVVLLAGLGLGKVLAQQPTDDHTLRRVRVPILMYHYVGGLPNDADEFRVNLTVSTELFRAHLQYLADNGYTTISFYELDAALRAGEPLPEKPVILTFDDGHLDHYTNVFPLLQEFEMTGTFFLITGLVDENNVSYLNWEQAREMAEAGMSMEAHTKNHPNLTERDSDFLTYQIVGSIESIEAHTGQTPRVFSYPGGRYDDAALSVLGSTPVIRAVTTEFGSWHTSDNHLLLPRLRVSNDTSVLGLSYLLTADAGQ